MFPTHRALGPVPSSAVSPLPPSLLVQSVTDPLTAAGPSLSLPTHPELHEDPDCPSTAHAAALCLSRAKHQHPDPGLGLGGASLPQGAGGGSRPATQASCVVTSLMS